MNQKRFGTKLMAVMADSTAISNSRIVNNTTLFILFSNQAPNKVQGKSKPHRKKSCGHAP